MPSHGHYRNGYASRTASSWLSARDRCTNIASNRYYRYGARGIRVEWESFEDFLRDMGECPPGHSLDRVDNDGNYCKENCRWATPAEQAQNRSTSKLTMADARTIRGMYASGAWTMNKLGELFNVSRVEIGHIVHNRHWKETPDVA